MNNCTVLREIGYLLDAIHLNGGHLKRLRDDLRPEVERLLKEAVESVTESLFPLLGRESFFKVKSITGDSECLIGGFMLYDKGHFITTPMGRKLVRFEVYNVDKIDAKNSVICLSLPDHVVNYLNARLEFMGADN